MKGNIRDKVSKIDKKRRREQRVVEEMIKLYCRKNHPQYKENNTMCPKCRELSEYAKQRSMNCPFMETKTFCANCKVHCYKPQMREEIKVVMRFSGPRMMLYHPVMALWHLICTVKEHNAQWKSAVGTEK